MLDKSEEELKAGKVVVKTMEELEAMENSGLFSLKQRKIPDCPGQRKEGLIKWIRLCLRLEI